MEDKINKIKVVSKEVNFDSQLVMSPQNGLSAQELKRLETTILSLLNYIKELNGASNFETWYKEIKQLFILKEIWYKYVCPETEEGYIETDIKIENMKDFV